MIEKPFDVLPYDINTLCAFISYQSDTPFFLVKQKRQITYIDNYLKRFNREKICCVYEKSYIDHHYMQDYTKYYVKCFRNYSSECSRIHFFEADNPEDCMKSLKNKFSSSGSTLDFQKYYLGFIVIRPIPQTFLAKVCFKPYCEKFLHQSYNISLFGLNLSVETIAFQEQDKVLAACATSALWSFFQAHPSFSYHNWPSASQITQSAYPEKNGHDREFPNSGLSTEMICRSLRQFNLMPQYFEFFKKSKSSKKDVKIETNLLKEYIYAYSSSGLPLILGVSVYDEEKNFIGMHAITVLGYYCNGDITPIKNDLLMYSSKITRIYVHDDRLGPYARLDFKKSNLQVQLDFSGTRSENPVFKPEIYIPNTLIMGVYHKIRIPYLSIKATCLALMAYYKEWLKKDSKKELIEFVESFIWKIQLKKISEIKEAILNSSISGKSVLLFKSWPKYIWSASVFLGEDCFFEFLFDATDIHQGEVFLDVIPWCESSEFFLLSLKEYCRERYNFRIRKDELTGDNADYLWGIIKYYNTRESICESLECLFGETKIPKRIKPHEVKNDLIKNQCLARLNQRCDPAQFQFQESETSENTYIWVIDEDGFLCIGIEEKDSGIGHPTLTDGLPARIGGEIRFSKDKWLINPFSGRYSADYSIGEKKRYLVNALQYRFTVFFPDDKFEIQEFEYLELNAKDLDQDDDSL